MQESRRMSRISFELLACLSLFQKSVRSEHFFSGEFASVFLGDPSLSRAQDVLEWSRKKNVRILYPSHPSYPSAFLHLENPPLFLACQGEPPWRERTCLSIVGSREPTFEALSWMDLQISRLLARVPSLVTVSGGARGIDSRAHLLSLRAGRPTVVFLPSGLAEPFPPEMKELENEILEAGGCILSEFAPFQRVRKHHFLQRNRMIASLSNVLFVVEARRRSGSTLTARLAREMGRTICVLPSFPGHPKSAGTLDLLFDGAFPIRDAEDLETLIGLTST